MTDLHPDALLDAAAAGTLTADDRRRLDDHCRVCSDCAFLLDTQQLFARGRLPGPRDQAVADAAVTAFLTRSAAPARSVAPATKSMPPLLRVAAAIAVLVLGGTAGAVGLIKLGVIDIAPPSPPTISGTPARRAVRRVASAPMPEPTSPAESPPALEAPAPAARNRPTPTPGAAHLYSEANQARRESRNADAIAGYRRLMQVHPTSLHALQSHVALGTLLLREGKTPAGALAQFDAYLQRAPGGTLAEEARAGRAQSLQRLGRTQAERGAWQDILERHPGSIHADRARRRLEEIR